MNLKSIHNVYFIGIGGIGMSALARYFNANGKYVGGYDKTKTEITDGLEGLGIDIHFKDAVENIKAPFLDKEKTLIVYTPAVPKGNKQLNYYLTHSYQVVKRSQILGLITENF